jgi:NADH dehydrogenase
MRRVTVFGGSGFIGRHLVKRLAGMGDVVRVAVRDPEAARFLRPMGNVGQVVPVRADIRDDRAVRAAVEGADAVVNLVAVLFERGRQRFQALHVDGAARIASASAAAGVSSLVQVSAMGASPDSPSAYARTKAAGEEAVGRAFPNAVILRPSVVFGPEDDFFNRFAALARVLPALPVFGCSPRLDTAQMPPRLDLWGSGGPRFQPVYVGDVADAIVRALSDEACRGKTYELGGPRTYSFKEIMELVLQATGRKRCLVPLPHAVADIQGSILGLLPNPPLTADQAKLLRKDNVVAPGSLAFADLGIAPTSVEAILPTYMDRFRPRGRFAA